MSAGRFAAGPRPRSSCLSARHTDTEKAALLDAGADDYVTKPFSNVELDGARPRAIPPGTGTDRAARHASPTPCLTFGDITVDSTAPARRAAAAQPIHLTPTEWALLRTFIAHPAADANASAVVSRGLGAMRRETRSNISACTWGISAERSKMIRYGRASSTPSRASAIGSSPTAIQRDRPPVAERRLGAAFRDALSCSGSIVAQRR